MLTLDRSHHQQFCLEAMQEVRREHRREQMTRDANARDEHKAMMNELRQSDGPFVDKDGNSIRKNARYYPPRLNMFNGEIISYTISGSPDLKMVTNMLDKAFKKEANLNGLIFHSDQGWHYQHLRHQKMLKDRGIIQSMSRKGNCLDNAMMENFFGLMKNELLYLREWDSIEQFKDELIKYIDYYNNDRIKLRLKGKSPVKYRALFQSRPTS